PRRAPQGVTLGRPRNARPRVARNLEQVLLSGHGLVDCCRHALHSTLQLPRVKPAPALVREELVRNVQRVDDVYAFAANYFPAVPDLAHLGVQEVHRSQEVLLLVFGAGDAQFAVEDVDLDAGPIRFHPPSSGSRLRRLSSRNRAFSIFSLSCLLSLVAAASCWRNSWLSLRRRWHSCTSWLILSSRESSSASIGTL